MSVSYSGPVFGLVVALLCVAMSLGTAVLIVRVIRDAWEAED